MVERYSIYCVLMKNHRASLLINFHDILNVKMKKMWHFHWRWFYTQKPPYLYRSCRDRLISININVTLNNRKGCHLFYFTLYTNYTRIQSVYKTNENNNTRTDSFNCVLINNDLIRRLSYIV